MLLGAAPGVGKTYEMLEEGRRLADDGRDVVIGVVETHGRAATAALVEGLPVVPRTTIVASRRRADRDGSRGRARAASRDRARRRAGPHQRPRAPATHKRWQDVDDLLDAGIDVITTVNVQHIESLERGGRADHGRRPARDGSGCRRPGRRPDRGRRPRAAVAARPPRRPGWSIRPSGSTRRCRTTSGSATSPRCASSPCCGSPTRSTAPSRRTAPSTASSGTWQARERVVVALTGGPEGETLLRRGARIAARSAGGELLAVHVSSQDGLRSGDPGALAAQRALVESLGGTYHQVVGDDVPRALVEFARSVNATQLVIGVSRRGRLAGRADRTRHRRDGDPRVRRHRRAHRDPRRRGRPVRAAAHHRRRPERQAPPARLRCSRSSAGRC